MASLTLPESAGAGSAARSRRARFLEVFNWHTVALAFYLTLLIALTVWLPMLYREPFEQWFFFVAYILRQFLYSAMLTLLGLAIAEAWLPEQMPARRRALAVFGILVVAITISAGCRMLTGRVEFRTLSGTLTWYAGVLAMWSLIGMLACGILTGLRRDRELQQRIEDERCERDLLAAQALEARLSALQAQIEPHFLFNTLANVKRLYETDARRGRQMLASLIDYLRAALPSMRQSGSTVEREVELARAYLTILQMRMGERLGFSITVEPGLQRATLPPLVLATLVENAVKHGLGPLPEGGRIDLRVRAHEGDLVVEVADTGNGFTASGGSGVGLANTRSRLAALHGERAHLSLRANHPRGVVAQVRLPLSTPAAAPGALQPVPRPA